MNIVLLEKYKNDCRRLIDTHELIEIRQLEDDETNPIHLLWMLDMIENDKTQSITKKHRWLGYIQGVLVCKNVFSVQEEREYTRDILNGD